jgi:hypothetical protein
VTDDGAGFDVGVVEVPEPGHIGLPTMVERAELADGRCEIESDRGGGTRCAWLQLGSASRSPRASYSRLVTFEALVYAPGMRPWAAASRQARSWTGMTDTADMRARSR